MIGYRSDIDGLRAVAVLPIVLFHAGVTAIPGGFTGVDVFFVISGFLITSIIQTDLEAGRFSLATFYRRRVVRIVPALAVMLVATLAVGCLLLLPGELRELGRSAAATAGFVSNIFFWKTANYFAGAAESKALLHTWSLGVEEQFYIFFPLLLLLVRKLLPGRLPAVLITVILGSFLLGVAVELKVPGSAANFYLLPSRAWELALGGLVAVGGVPSVTRPATRAALAWSGLALIVLGLFAVGPGSAFPIPWALPSAVGTALLIAYTPGTFAARLLSARPAVAIGQVSYSLYLWHWPIIVFYRLTVGATLTWQATVLLVLASFVAAVASRELVEKPFLARFRAPPSLPKIVTGLVALTAVVAAGLVLSVNADKVRDLPPDVRRIAGYGDYANSAEWRYQYRRGPCFAGEGEVYRAERCLMPSVTRPNVLVLGDSHAAQYWRAVSLALPEAHVVQATASGCRPVLPVVGAPRCTDMVRHVLGRALEQLRPRLVVIGGRWRLGDVAGAERTVAFLRRRGVRVVVIGPTVEYHGDFSQLLARAMLSQDFAGLDRLRAKEQRSVDAALAPGVRRAGGRYVSAYAIECPGDRCRYVAPGGAPMQFDYGHLTLPAARYVIARADLRGTRDIP